MKRSEVTIAGADQSAAITLKGAMAGSPFSLVGSILRVGDYVLVVVGWESLTNAIYVPQAAQLFADNLSAAIP